MKSIGIYSQPVGYGEVIKQPFFDMRETYLEMVKRKSLQVLVGFLGDFVWINVERNQLQLSGNPSQHTNWAKPTPTNE